MKKTIYLLNIDNYAPEITAITYPFIRRYAKKIGAEIVEIKERLHPDFPPVYEKLQIFDLEKERQSDWIIYIDSDALIHPDMYDVTAMLPMDTVLQVGTDFSPNRSRPNKYMIRDGRWIGTCNWFTVFSRLTLDLYNPDIGMTREEIERECFPTQAETFVFDRQHLIDDYILTTNLARYGLKYKNLREWQKEMGMEPTSYFYHEYLIPNEEKVLRLKERMDEWLTNFPAIDLERTRKERAEKKKILEGEK